jgi:membrane-associated protein
VLLAWLVDLVLHLDRHLDVLVSTYHVWVYAILFAVIFAETGLVVTPFLPGDSLLFAVGALAAVNSDGTLSAPLATLLLGIAAVLGNTTNYAIGRAIGPPAFSGRYRLLKREHLEKTREFFERYGGLAITLSRFMPIIRTFAPFVAGVGRMPYHRFQGYNLVGGFAWVSCFLWLGYLFGNIPAVKQNFGLVTIFIAVVSVVPVLISLRKRRAARAAAL